MVEEITMILRRFVAEGEGNVWMRLMEKWGNSYMVSRKHVYLSNAANEKKMCFA